MPLYKPKVDNTKGPPTGTIKTIYYKSSVNPRKKPPVEVELEFDTSPKKLCKNCIYFKKRRFDKFYKRSSKIFKRHVYLVDSGKCTYFSYKFGLKKNTYVVHISKFACSDFKIKLSQ